MPSQAQSTPPAPPTSRRRELVVQLCTWLFVAVVLSGVLYLYAQPGFLVMLSDMMWACFGVAS